MMRRFILSITAVAAILLGLEKVGVFHLIPPGDLGFRASTQELSDGRQALIIQTDTGNLDCWIRLRVQVEDVPSPIFQAWTASGEPLVVGVEATQGPMHTLTVSKPPTAGERAYFLWRAGLPVTVSVDRLGSAVLLDGWEVHSSNQPSDSHQKARMRTIWTWASWILLLLTAAGAILAALGKPESSLVSGRDLVEAIVESVSDKDATQTTRVRRLLRSVLLESMPVDQALNALRIPTSPKHVRPQIVARARHLFVERVATIESELDGYAARLG